MFVFSVYCVAAASSVYDGSAIYTSIIFFFSCLILVFLQVNYLQLMRALYKMCRVYTAVSKYTHL